MKCTRPLTAVILTYSCFPQRVLFIFIEPFFIFYLSPPFSYQPIPITNEPISILCWNKKNSNLFPNAVRVVVM